MNKYWLFDGAQLAISEKGDLGEHLEFLRHSEKLIDLYADEPDEIRTLGPMLCAPDKEISKKLWKLILAYPGYYASLIQVGECSLQEMAQSLAASNFIETDSAERYYLRYADTRVLQVLPKISNKTQWAHLTQHIEAWSYIDRSQSIQKMQIATVQPEGDGEGLIWSRQQIAALIDCTWPDALLAEVCACHPHWQKPQAWKAHYDSVCVVLARAEQDGFAEDVPRLIEHCVAEIQAKNQGVRG